MDELPLSLDRLFEQLHSELPNLLDADRVTDFEKRFDDPLKRLRQDPSDRQAQRWMLDLLLEFPVIRNRMVEITDRAPHQFFIQLAGKTVDLTLGKLYGDPDEPDDITYQCPQNRLHRFGPDEVKFDRRGRAVCPLDGSELDAE